MEGSGRKMLPSHSSGAGTIQARYTQTERGVLTKFPSLLSVSAFSPLHLPTQNEAHSLETNPENSDADPRTQEPPTIFI